MSTSDAIDGISCSRGLAPFCRQAAAAENKKKLPEDQLLAWIGISKDCDSSCILTRLAGLNGLRRRQSYLTKNRMKLSTVSFAILSKPGLCSHHVLATGGCHRACENSHRCLCVCVCRFCLTDDSRGFTRRVYSLGKDKNLSLQ